MATNRRERVLPECQSWERVDVSVGLEVSLKSCTKALNLVSMPGCVIDDTFQQINRTPSQVTPEDKRKTNTRF